MTNPVDDIFALASDASNTDTATPTPDASSTQPEATDTPSSATEALYPNVFATYTADQLPDGENPEGALTIAEFASQLTVDNIINNPALGLNGVVKDNAIYNGTKAKNHPLPVILVFAEGTTDFSDQKSAKVYIPFEQGKEAYNTRPERGATSNAATSKRSQDELLSDAGKKLNKLADINERFERVKKQKEAAESLLAKYEGWLRPFYKDTEPVEVDDESAENGKRTQTRDEAVNAAVKAAIADKADEIAEAEDKAKEIPDAEKTNA